jgi:hypothetical protein
MAVNLNAIQRIDNEILKVQKDKANAASAKENEIVREIESVDLKGQVFEVVKSRDPFILRARESSLIKKFDTFRNGLNNEP